MNNLILLIARLLMTFMFILSGVQKILNYDGTVAYMISKGVPGTLLIPVIGLELVGALCIIIGLWTRLAAYALAAFCIAAAVIFHNDFSVQSETISFMKNLTIAGGFLVLGVFGAGNWRIGVNRSKKTLFS